MQLTIVGGGGFRTPLVYGALLGPSSGVTQVVLHDVDEARLRAVSAVLAQTGAGRDGGAASQAPTVRLTTDLDRALEGADFVFSAVRVGGLAARVADERVALDLGVLGQETTGPGGISFGLRTVPVARRIAERVRVVAPDAWVINFTNPAGMITEAMQSVFGDRVVGICDTPITMAKRAALLLGIPAGEPLEPDYVGLNHLGWLRGLRHHGVDVLPRLLADDGLLAATEEGQLFGLDWLRTLGALPNEYLYYTYFTREAVEAIRAGGPTRGEFLRDQQDRFYATVAADPSRAGELWRATRREREDTYMAAEHAGSPRGGETGVADVGGYEGVALALMHAISRDERASMILNVRNGSTVPGLPPDAVVEVPVAVDRDGPSPWPISPPDLHQLGLMAQVKAVERLTIEAAVTGSAAAAEKAFALHPLVDSVTTARRLLRGYRARIPEVDAVFDGRVEC